MGVFQSFFFNLSKHERIQDMFRDFGPAKRFAHRFVAGESMTDAVQVTQRLREQGLEVTLDHLGEDVEDEETARNAAQHYNGLLDTIDEYGLDASISVKLSQIGLAFDKAFCRQQLQDLLGHAAEKNVNVEIDMERSDYTQDTLDLYREVNQEFDNVAVCVQANLKRTAEDVEDLIGTGGGIRLVKGAYKEPPNIAYQDKKQVDTNYRKLLETLLKPEVVARNHVFVGTHDPAMIQHATELMKHHGVRRDVVTFEMLHGIGDDLKNQLTRDGYNVRVYLPYGREWYPYFMRRLAERPANAWFLLKHLL